MPKLASNASMSAETAGDEIHRKREDEGIEEETEDAVRQHHPAHGPRRHLHVGDLARHADDIGEIEKIPIVRQFVAGKFEAAAILSSLARRVVAVEMMTVMQREHGMNHGPRRENGQRRQHESYREYGIGRVSRLDETETERQQADERG